MITDHLPSLSLVSTFENAQAHGWNVSDRHPNLLVKTGLPSRVPFCNDCRTLHPSPYMVHNSIWRVVNPVNTTRLFLCFSCLEKRLERKLVIDDFTHARLNYPIHLGYELRKREERPADADADAATELT